MTKKCCCILPLNLCLCPAKFWSNADFAPQNHIDIVSGAKITTEIILKFAPQNYRAFISCPAKLWSNEDFAPQNHIDIVSGAKITTEIILKLNFVDFFCK